MKKLTAIPSPKKSHMRILGFMLANPGRSFTQLGIAKSMGKEKSYKNVRESIQELAEQGIISKQKVGFYVLCSLNFRELKTLDYISYVENYKRYEMFKKVRQLQEVSERLIEQVKLHTTFFTLLLFGSYAKGTYHEKSDVDLLIIADKKYHAGIGQEIAHLQAVYTVKLNFFVMTQKDYEGMLTGKELINVGKESLKSHILLYGTELYYQIVRDTLWQGTS